MPELPEVESLRRSLYAKLRGLSIEAVYVYEDRLRQKVAKQRLLQTLPGLTIGNIRRRAKYLLFDLYSSEQLTQVLVVHLGMTGRLLWVDRPLLSPLSPKILEPVDSYQRQKHDHIIFEFGLGYLCYNDIRRFGLVSLVPAMDIETYPILQKLGIEPLEAEFTAECLFRLTRKVNKSLKTFLLCNEYIVGIGNIYAAEALFKARINPFMPAKDLSRAAAQRLVKALKELLELAIGYGGTTFRDFAGMRGERGAFVNFLQVYGKHSQPCPVCSSEICRVTHGGRSTFYCEQCQK